MPVRGERRLVGFDCSVLRNANEIRERGRNKGAVDDGGTGSEGVRGGAHGCHRPVRGHGFGCGVIARYVTRKSGAAVLRGKPAAFRLLPRTSRAPSPEVRRCAALPRNGPPPRTTRQTIDPPPKPRPTVSTRPATRTSLSHGLSR